MKVFAPVSLSVPVDLGLFLCWGLGALLLLLLLLLGLQCGEVDVPDEDAFEDEDEEHDDKYGEQVWLIVEGSDSLRRGADLAEPIELTHGRSFVLNYVRERCDRKDSVCLACSARRRRGCWPRARIEKVYKQLDQQIGRAHV